MLRAASVEPAGAWSGRPSETIVLDYDERHRRRVTMTSVRGLTFLLDLAEATVLHNGDALVLEDGRRIEVVAAPEDLAEIATATPANLVRIAWHLGNRHLPVEIAGRKLRIRRDHVIEDMIRGLGGTIVPIEAPFDPEGGAYADGAQAHHGHDHGHEHPHHDHAHHDHEH